MSATRSLISALLVLAVLAGACSDDDTADPTTTTAAADGDGASQDPDGAPDGTQSTPEASELYADPANWLCRPELEADACDIDLDATLVSADGTQIPEPFEAAVDAPVDCIYYYPTISTDEGANSDLVPGEAEAGIAQNQAARFAEVCNVYAPMYRQVPLGALFDNLGSGDDDTTTTLDPEDPQNPRNIAYSDVRESFMHYLAEDNDGRPFVLMGHSQGAGHLNRLIAEEIDGNDELREQMLSAMLIGSSVAVDGEDASFENIPACTTPEDTGCVVSYASFYEDEPPPEDSLFGRLRSGDGRALCTNPAALGGGPADLSSYFQAGHAEGAPVVDTPWVHYETLLVGECVSDEEFDWLQVTPSAAPPFPPDLGARITPQWGTHLADVNFTIGDLISLVRSQSGQV